MSREPPGAGAQAPAAGLAASAVVLRPRSLSEVLDLACRLAMAAMLGVYARLAAILLLPIFVLALALRRLAGFPPALVWLVAIVGSGAVQGAFTVAVGRQLVSEPIGALGALRLYRGRLFAYLGALLLSRGLLAAATLVGLVGLPFAWPRLWFVHEAVLLEGASPIAAIQRSARFVDGRALAVFGGAAAVVAAQLAFVVTSEVLCQGIVSDVLQLGKPFGALFKDGFTPYALAGFLASVPWVATARFLQYVDGRTRADGWDIQLRFMAIAAAEGERRRAA
jgi:hypothetical protein